MFISLLNPEQQEGLCAIVQFIASLDGESDQREEMLVAALLEESNLSAIPAAANSGDEVEALLSRFDTPVSKHALLLECFGVALADDVLHENELKAIRAMATSTDVSEAWIERARDYVQRALETQREGLELLRPSF